MLGILMKSKFSITQKESRYNISKQNNCIGDRAECSQCGKWLHKRGLKRHIEDVHNHSSAKQEFVCDVCNKSFKKSLSNLQIFYQDSNWHSATL